VVLLAGKELVLLLPKLAGGAPTARVTSMLGYGVAFAIASLSCAIGPFLTVAGVALSSGDLRLGLAAFTAYAVGMGLVVAALAVAAALASTAVAAGIRRILPHLGLISGVLLVVTGAYVGYYGLYELRLYHAGGEASDPIVDGAGRVQDLLSGLVSAIGPVPLTILVVALAGGGVLLGRRRRVPHDG
jgi:cytochrome c-type biogenesis protein